MFLKSLLQASVIALLSVVSAVPTARDAPFAGHKVFRFELQNDDARELLSSYIYNDHFNIVLWSEGLNAKQVDIQLSPADAKTLQSTLLNAVPNTVLVEDVQALVDREAAHTRANSDQTSSRLGPDYVPSVKEMFGDFQDHQTMWSFMNSLDGAEEFIVGKTYLNNTIKGYKIGTGDKAIVYHGGIHAREWISPAVATYIGHQLATNPEAEDLRTKFTFYVIPVLNVDSYKATRASSSNRMVRKNQQPNTGFLGSRCTGTDLNRNFNFKWGTAGSSTNPCSDTYQGTSPASAPETKALQDFIAGIGNVVGYIDFHSYSQMWMYPWGYSCSAINNDAASVGKGSQIAVDALKQVNGKVFVNGDICNTIYPASGSSVDFTYGTLGVKYSYAVELRDTGRNGFILPASEIVPSGEETWQAVLALWRYVATQV